MLTPVLNSRLLLALTVVALGACDPASGDSGGAGDTAGTGGDGGTGNQTTLITTANPTLPTGDGMDNADDATAGVDESPDDGVDTASADDAGTTASDDAGTTASDSAGTTATEGGTTATEGGTTTGSTEGGPTSGGVMGVSIDELDPGDLRVTEIMYDPAFCNDADCEWVEVFNATGEAVDLQGLVIEDSAGGTGTIDQSAVVPANSYVVLARGSAALFGYATIQPLAYYGADPALNNTGDDLVLLRNTVGTILDQSETWTGQGTLDDGVSFKRNGDATWCYSTATFEDADLGSPGEANESACNAPLPGGICMDVDVPGGSCTDMDPDNCICAGCSDNGTCDVNDDCTCSDCVLDAFCSAPENCNDDGFCSPFNEGCQCDDCAEHPSCL